jgi:hypothetical protein
MTFLSHVFVTFFSSIVVLNQNGPFLDCATTAFSDRYGEKKTNKVKQAWKNTEV